MKAGVVACERVLARFAFPGPVTEIAPIPGGHINASFRVETAGGDGFLVQRLNPAVFPDASAVMHNVTHLTRHIGKKLDAAGVADRRRRALTLVPTRSGHSWHRAPDGACWRAFEFIRGTRTVLRADTPEAAEGAARAFGAFLGQVADYAGPPLSVTIPGFHDTRARLAALDAAAAADPAGRAAAASEEIRYARAERALGDLLPPRQAAGEVPVRIAHNDAKIANVLFDEVTGDALCVVDLDTVMPGSMLHDFGDLVRSTVCPADEDEADLARVAADPARFAALARGYLGAAGGLLAPAERELLVTAGRLITLEQAIRFLTDHLEGDRYYPADRDGHNLQRARVQLRLYQSLTERAREFEDIVASLLP